MAPTTSTNPHKTIGTSYAALLALLPTVESHIGGLKVSLRDAADEAARIEDERKRDQDKALYAMNTARQLVLDEHARQDAERMSKHVEENAVLAAAQGEIGNALKIPLTSDKLANSKAIVFAFSNQLAKAHLDGEGKGKAMAEKEHVADKKLVAAEAATASALLNQKVETLTKERDALQKRCDDLAAQNAKHADAMKELGMGAFSAAGGVVKQGNESLARAAEAGNPQRNR